MRDEEVIETVDRYMQHWVGIAAFLILTRLEGMEQQLMALADEIARLQTVADQIAGDVTAIQGAEPGMTPEQQAALDSIATNLEAAHTALNAVAPH